MKITLCGSTKFTHLFDEYNRELSIRGHLVYSIAVCLPRSESGDQLDQETKRRLDLVHLSKIDASDAIVVLNRDKYVGESTTREIEYAIMRGKEVYWLEHPLDDVHVQDEVREMIRKAMPDSAMLVSYLMNSTMFWYQGKHVTKT